MSVERCNNQTLGSVDLQLPPKNGLIALLTSLVDHKSLRVADPSTIVLAPNSQIRKSCEGIPLPLVN